MIVTVVGCGEAFDDHLPNTSLLVRVESALLLLDCGFSVPPALWRMEPDPDAIAAIWLSHAHADHYFGLPALLRRMVEDGRTKPIALMGEARVLDAASQVIGLGYRSLSGRLEIQCCPVERGREFQALGCSFRFAETRHSVTNYALRVEAGESVLCYSGDGAISEASRDLARGAGLWVQEAYSFEPSDRHADVPDVLRSAAGVQARRVALVHVHRKVRSERAQLFEAMLTAPVLCALPEPGSVFLN